MDSALQIILEAPMPFRPSRNPVRALALPTLVALAVVLSGTTPSAAAGVAAPLGYSMLCLKSPDECRAGGASKVKSSEKLLATLKRVNSSINRAIKPRNDAGPDVWTVNAKSGDCEDYVMAKRRALIKAGVASSSLRIAYVKTRKGIDHAVLIVRTDRQELVLDNLSPSIKPFSQTGYRMMSRSGSNPMKWS